METTEIIEYLYTHYCLKDDTPEQFVSSHWKYYQGQVKVQMEGGNVESLAGTAFGDLQNKSIVKRVFSWLTIGSYLLKLPNRKETVRLIRPSTSLTDRMGLTFSYDCFRQICSLVLIRRFLKDKRRLNVIIIGDGYGFLASLIKQIYPHSVILLVDLGKILLFQAYYCGRAHPNCSHYLVNTRQETNQNELNYDFIYCPAENLKMINNLSFDLAINIASMQEMNRETIEFYFSYLRQHLVAKNLFYCCNREKKIMPGGEVSEFSKYPWSESDIHVVDDYCPWYTYYLSYGTAKNGPKLLNYRIPFINYFDGPIRHRLTTLDVVK